MKNCIGLFVLLFLSSFLGTVQLTYAELKTSTTKVSMLVAGPEVAITSELTTVDAAKISLLDSTLTSMSSSFVVKTNSVNTSYDVWISVPDIHLNPDADIYLALNSDQGAFLPLTVSLTGNSGENSVNVNPAALQSGTQITARPTTNKKSDGNGVMGTNLSGTTYTVTVTEDNTHYDIYNEIPAGTYTLVLMANVATN